VPNPKPPQARTARARGVGRAGAGGPCGPWLSPAPVRIPRRAHSTPMRGTTSRPMRGAMWCRAAGGPPGTQSCMATWSSALLRAHQARGRLGGGSHVTASARCGAGRQSARATCQCAGAARPHGPCQCAGGARDARASAQGSTWRTWPRIEFFRILPTVLVVLYRDSPIEDSSKDGQNSKKLNFL